MTTPAHVEDVELHGHIIDSLLFPKVLDEILTRGGSYTVRDIRVGHKQTDPSFVKMQVQAPTAELLEEILNAIHDAIDVRIPKIPATPDRVRAAILAKRNGGTRG